MTGREVERALLEAIAQNPRIRVLEEHTAVDLILMPKFGGPDQCVGAYVLDNATGAIETLLARATVLATGGAGKVYLYTTNPDVATGDGVAMAFRAGAEVANMEFYQFHPTCLFHVRAKNFLISEALRGGGGLARADGVPFMKRHRAGDSRRARTARDRLRDEAHGLEHVLLDISDKPASFVRASRTSTVSVSSSASITRSRFPSAGGATCAAASRGTLPHVAGLWAIGSARAPGFTSRSTRVELATEGPSRTVRRSSLPRNRGVRSRRCPTCPRGRSALWPRATKPSS
jgi:L-aspartate oxidase